MDFSLKDKSILVSGGGRGIGAAICQALGAEGAQVAISYTGTSESSKEKATQVAAAVETAGGKSLLVPLNVADESQCEAAIKSVVSEFGGIHGLVNNAGIAIDQLTLRYKSDDWDKLMSINLKGAFMLSQKAMRYLMKNKEGSSIVMMSSVVGLSGNAGQAPYSASKAGLVGLTKSLALEMASRKLRVNAVAPGFIETDMTGALDETQKEKITAQIPLNSLGSPEDVAAATLFLLSPLSRYITGQVLSVNGGLYM